jgi:L-threonylcarbamoyladenylate synthase
MDTLICQFKDKRIKEELLKGSVVALPTETVYGLGVRYDQETSFEELVKVKKRRPDKPFTMMLGKTDLIDLYCQINDQTRKIIKTFMPGEITILVKPKKNIYPWVSLDSKYIGVRVPDHQELLDLLNEVEIPLLVTSANISSCPSLVTTKEVDDTFHGLIPLIVEGSTRSSTPSTIVICDEELILVRQGKIKFEDIKKVWEE